MTAGPARGTGATGRQSGTALRHLLEAWPIPDTRVLIREWPNEAVSQDGRIENVPMRGKTGMPGSDRVEERPPKP